MKKLKSLRCHGIFLFRALFLSALLLICCYSVNRAWAGPGLSQSSSSGARSLRVAGVKSEVTKNIKANTAAIKLAIDYAIKQKADILLTPEGSLSGYYPGFDKKEVEAALKDIVGYASAGKLGLALGTCYYEEDGKCYNQIRFYDGDGNFLGSHSKILLTGDFNDPSKGEINEYASTPLRTFMFKGIIIAGLICNDLWANPGCTTLPDTHLSMQLSKMGARIIFHAVNGGRSGTKGAEVYWNFHEINLRLRAQSGKTWIVTADNSYPTHFKSSCPSGVIKPDGNWACETEAKGVQLFSYTINLDN